MQCLRPSGGAGSAGLQNSSFFKYTISRFSIHNFSFLMQNSEFSSHLIPPFAVFPAGFPQGRRLPSTRTTSGASSLIFLALEVSADASAETASRMAFIVAWRMLISSIVVLSHSATALRALQCSLSQRPLRATGLAGAGAGGGARVPYTDSRGKEERERAHQRTRGCVVSALYTASRSASLSSLESPMPSISTSNGI